MNISCVARAMSSSMTSGVQPNPMEVEFDLSHVRGGCGPQRHEARPLSVGTIVYFVLACVGITGVARTLFVDHRVITEQPVVRRTVPARER